MNDKKDQIIKQKEQKNSAIKPKKKKEIGGTDGPEPTRYGDWEHKGRCIDF